MTSDSSGDGERADSRSTTASAKARLLLGFDSRPEHLSQRTRLRAEWATAMIQSWQMGDAIQLMNELAMRELLAADLADSAALARAKIKLEVVSEFQTTLAQLVSDWEIVEAAREREEAAQRREGVQ